MNRRYLLFPLLALLLVPSAVQAQETTFTVTVIASTDDNPRPDPWSVVYAIDGVESAALTLVRGETYEFQMNDVPGNHPFYISTDDEGAGAGEWTEGVTGNFATMNETLTFTVPMSAPDLLYYECGNHPRMGWQLNIVNPTSTEDGAQPTTLTLAAPYPNPFADQATLMLGLDRAQDVTVEVFSTSGRRVAVLHDGVLPGGRAHPLVLDAVDLADGTYLVRARAGDTVVERRVTLVR